MKKVMKKDELTDTPEIIIDGEKYTISKDKKHITGPKTDLTTEEFREQKGKKIPFLVAPPETVKKGAVYGFSDEAKLVGWFKEVNLYDTYKKDKEMDKYLKQFKTDDEREKFAQQQIKKIQIATEKHEKLLKKYNLKSNDFDKIQEKKLELGPEDDQHSLYLYDYTWFNGRGIIIPGGRWWWFWIYPYEVPKLSSPTWNFDKLAESLSKWGSDHARVYSGEKYTGVQLYIWTHIADLDCYFGIYFRNKIRSCKVY